MQCSAITLPELGTPFHYNRHFMPPSLTDQLTLPIIFLTIRILIFFSMLQSVGLVTAAPAPITHVWSRCSCSWRCTRMLHALRSCGQSCVRTCGYPPRACCLQTPSGIAVSFQCVEAATPFRLPFKPHDHSPPQLSCTPLNPSDNQQFRNTYDSRQHRLFPTTPITPSMRSRGRQAGLSGGRPAHRNARHSPRR